MLNRLVAFILLTCLVISPFSFAQEKKTKQAKPAAKKAEVKKPESKKPESKKPESKKPESKKPESKKAATKKAETKAPAPKAAADKESKEKEPTSKDSFADADILAGHSQHGEAFNEGPRQRAYLMGGTGSVRFPVTSKIPKARKLVEQGLGQLHGFWYFEAERSFRQAATLDPNCAIAYWGMAKANSRNTKRSKEFIKNAIERKPHASDLEVRLIDALNDYLNGKGKSNDKTKAYVGKLEAISKAYPDVLEIKALVGYEYYRRRTVLKKSYEDVDKYLNAIIEVEPLHPVHHYRIHLWDYKDPSKALSSSAKCGAGSPSIAHMWHMPGHIYSRLKRYQDAAWQQEASARVDHSHMMRDRVLPDQIHNFAHNNEWLTRNLNHIGRWQDAIDLAKNMIELPRHPKYNTLARGSTNYGRRRLFETLNRFEKWNEMVELCNSSYLPATDRSTDQITRLRYLGVAYAELGDSENVAKVMKDLNDRLQKVVAAEKKKKADKSKKKSSRRGSQKGTLEKHIALINGHVAVQQGDFAKALPLLKKGGEDAVVQARIQSLAGKHDDAVKAADGFMKSRQAQTQALAGRIEILWRANKKDLAKKAFETLRPVSGSVQFGTPVFDRLEPIASDLGLPSDWRVAHKHPQDFGPRPKLSSLGPFRWQPMPAEPWTLPTSTGSKISLDSYRGKPVVVIFYLGYGCLHCAEQLKSFAPKTKAFQDAGIEIVAISTDDQKDLKKSIDDYEGGMPFPLVANQSLEIFKAYRAFDDFEQAPLHGTYLIDANGLVRWQDISFEPFNNPDFLLKEAQRLLAQPIGRKSDPLAKR